jgi:archaellum biogenesis ATPase FlaH
MAIDHFLEVSPGSVVLLDGVEYMVAHNDFPSILTLLHDLNEKVSVTNSILLIPVDPKALEEREFTLLRRDLKLLEPSSSFRDDSRVELSPGPSPG